MKLAKRKVKELLKGHILHQIKSNQGWEDFTGVSIKNNSDTDIYVLFFTGMDVE